MQSRTTLELQPLDAVRFHCRKRIERCSCLIPSCYFAPNPKAYTMESAPAPAHRPLTRNHMPGFDFLTFGRLVSAAFGWSSMVVAAAIWPSPS